MPTENRSIPIHADDEAAILKMHSTFLDRPAEERADASTQLQDEAYALGRSRGKADQAEQHQGEPAAYQKPSDYWEGFGYVDRSCLVELRKMVDHLERQLDSVPDGPLYTHAEPAEVGQLRKDVESYKQHTLNAAITIGQICEALGIDDHSEPDMIIEAAKSMLDGLNRIVQECPLGTPGFAIACEVLGELGVQQDTDERSFCTQ